MDEEWKKERLFEIWKMYEDILKRFDDWGQSFYGFGEKVTENFGEKMKTKTTGKALTQLCNPLLGLR